MLIILDRDGVINEDSDAFIKTPEEWLPIPHSLAAIAQLNRAGHIVTIATNQSGIGRGLYSEEGLAEIHAKMQQALAQEGGHIDGIYYCPHLPDQGCACRKPRPGLLLQIAQDYNYDLSQALLIGDAERDILAAQAVNCPAVLVKTGKGIQNLGRSALSTTPVYKNLAEVVAALLRGEIKPV